MVLIGMECNYNVLRFPSLPSVVVVTMISWVGAVSLLTSVSRSASSLTSSTASRVVLLVSSTSSASRSAVVLLFWNFASTWCGRGASAAASATSVESVEHRRRSARFARISALRAGLCPQHEPLETHHRMWQWSQVIDPGVIQVVVVGLLQGPPVICSVTTTFLIVFLLAGF